MFSEQTTFAPQIARFIVLRELGRGGMGVVYVAYEETLDRRVALKLLYEMQGDDAERQSRLLREAQAMARLNHPNIAAVYEAGTHEGRVVDRRVLSIRSRARRSTGELAGERARAE